MRDLDFVFVALAISVTVPFLMILIIIFNLEDTECAESHTELIYHPPVYVNMGNGINIPVGGGLRPTEVCTKWIEKKKGKEQVWKLC